MLMCPLIHAITMDMNRVIPEVEMKATLPANQGRPSLFGPGKSEKIDLEPLRAGRRMQELEFDIASAIVRDRVSQPGCEIPAHELFSQVLAIARRYLRDFVAVREPLRRIDAGMSPYFGWIVERIQEDLIRPAPSQGKTPELPLYETHRGPGTTAEVDFWTTRDVREVVHSHVNFVVADTQRWEQSAAFFIDTSPYIHAFVKNSGLGFAVPYVNNGETHDYVPDFIVRLKTECKAYLILETKGYDELAEIKAAAAKRWIGAVNADGKHGRWFFAMVNEPAKVTAEIVRAFGRAEKSQEGQGRVFDS